jgi:hypothetical protein
MPPRARAAPVRNPLPIRYAGCLPSATRIFRIDPDDDTAAGGSLYVREAARNAHVSDSPGALYGEGTRYRHA